MTKKEFDVKYRYTITALMLRENVSYSVALDNLYREYNNTNHTEGYDGKQAPQLLVE